MNIEAKLALLQYTNDGKSFQLKNTTAFGGSVGYGGANPELYDTVMYALGYLVTPTGNQAISFYSNEQTPINTLTCNDALNRLPATVYESAHPYANNVSTKTLISFEGASSLEISFHADTVLEEDYDYVKFLKGDGSNETDYWGTGKYDDGTGYPGVNGASTLVIEASSFTLQFVTDSSDTFYGYKFTVTPTYPSPSVCEAANVKPLEITPKVDGIYKFVGIILERLSLYPLGGEGLANNYYYDDILGSSTYGKIVKMTNDSGTVSAVDLTCDLDLVLEHSSTSYTYCYVNFIYNANVKIHKMVLETSGESCSCGKTVRNCMCSREKKDLLLEAYIHRLGTVGFSSDEYYAKAAQIHEALVATFEEYDNV